MSTRGSMLRTGRGKGSMQSPRSKREASTLRIATDMFSKQHSAAALAGHQWWLRQCLHCSRGGSKGRPGKGNRPPGTPGGGSRVGGRSSIC